MKVVLFLIVLTADGFDRRPVEYDGPQTDERCRQVGEAYVRNNPEIVRGYICR